MAKTTAAPAEKTYAERVSEALIARNARRDAADAQLAAAMEAVHVARATRESEHAAADADFQAVVAGPRDEA